MRLERVERREDLAGGVEGDGVAQDVDDAGGARERLALLHVLRELLVHAREALHGPAVVAGVLVLGRDLRDDGRQDMSWDLGLELHFARYR